MAFLIDLALGLPGMSTLFIAESVVYVLLKSAMHSCKFSTALWYDKQLWSQDALQVFLQIANTGIYKKKQEKNKNQQQKQTKTQYPTAQTALFRALAFFLVKIWTLPHSVRDSWLCCSGVFFDTWLAHFKILWKCTLISDFAETSRSVQRPKQEVACEELHV